MMNPPSIREEVVVSCVQSFGETCFRVPADGQSPTSVEVVSALLYLAAFLVHEGLPRLELIGEEAEEYKRNGRAFLTNAMAVYADHLL